MKRKITALAIVTGAALLAACQVIAGIERVHKVDEDSLPEEEGGTSGKPSGSPDPCQHAAPPPSPEAGADPTEIPPFFLATAKLSLINPADNGIGGYDLDGACTCDTRKGTAFDGGSSCTPHSGSVKCDPVDSGGVDNQGASLFNTFYTLSGRNLDDAYNANVASGIGANILLYISGWNGQPDDLDVSVGIFVSEKVAPNGAPDQDTTGNFGTWTYPTSVTPSGGPSGQGTGYVAKGVLVVRNAGIVKVLFGGAGLTFNDAVIIGDISRDPTTKKGKFVGVVGGRIRDDELLSAAGQVGIGNGMQACQDDGIFTAVKLSICSSLDIGHSVQADFKGAECDAVSSAVAITSLEASIDPSGVPVDPKPPNQDGPCTQNTVNKANPTKYKCF